MRNKMLCFSTTFCRDSLLGARSTFLQSQNTVQLKDYPEAEEPTQEYSFIFHPSFRM